MNMYGWAGKILRVDLSKGKIVEQSLPKELARNFIGGRGINVRILLEETKPGTAAFDPENLLIFGTGPLTGTLAPGTGRFNVTTRSPQGFLGDTNCGGHWAPELKFAGYDHIVIVGKSKKPSYLAIQNNDVQLKSATHLWGKDTWETQKILKNELGDSDVQTVCIGPAGENLVRFACVRTGLKNSAGRTGTGAVMGSKNLKAIAVRGTKAVQIAHPERHLEAVGKVYEKIKETIKSGHGYMGKDPKKAKLGGTYSAIWFLHNDFDALVTRHHQSGYWEDAIKLDPKIFHEKYVKRMVGCFGCPVPCTPYFEIEEGAGKRIYGEGPEFEGIAAFGAAPNVTDLKTVIKSAINADKYGVDCDSCGRVISYAMELFQRGIISEKDVGFPLEWGDGEAVLRLIDMISKREGFGDILAEGEVRAGNIIGKEAKKYALAIKGVEQHENLRAAAGTALAQATSSRGADHLRSEPNIEWFGMPPEEAEKTYGYKSAVDPAAYEGKASLVILYEYHAALIDMLETCKFFSYWLSPYFTEDLWSDLFYSATGIQAKGRDLFKATERVVNVERLFIMREGARRKDDYPTWRDFEEPLPSGRFKGRVLDRTKYDAMLDEYYKLHGWDEKTGVPHRENLHKLGLDFALETQNQIVSKLQTEK
jgi:aldehyde:ferredoxin oxidoreductase